MLHIMVALLLTLFPFATKEQCIEQSDGCLKCVTENICIICDFGWELETTNNTCTKCLVGCMTCSSGMCEKCFSGFTLVNGLCGCPLGKGADISSNTCIDCLISNCQNCSFKADECTECTNGLGLISSSPWCRACQDINCIECKNDYSICVFCNEGFGLSYGVCSACSYGCKICSNDISSCEDCFDGYGLYSYYPNYCEECSYEHGIGCLKCQTNFISNCTECIPNATRHVYDYGSYCNYCYASYCQECEPGSYSLCKTCISGYVLYNGQCSNCTSLPNCRVCSFVAICTSCISNFVLVGSTCSACLEGCYCYSGGGTLCYSCLAMYGMNELNVCTRCTDTNCNSCYSNYTICTYCNTNYTIFNSTICVPCNSTITNCISCSSYSKTCYSCIQKENHGLYNGECDVPCIPLNCKQCYSSASYCGSCFEGYFRLYPDCVPCSDVISECKTCIGQDSSAMCTLCNDGYSLKNNQCHPCDNPQCSLCPLDKYTCTLCIAPYNLYSGSCITCIDNKCIECLPNDPINCTKCADGYGAQAGSCVTCSSSDCLQCSESPTVCTLCVLGLGPLNGNCVACAVANCLQCSEISSKCQKCNAGYLLSGELSCQTCSDINCNYCLVSFSNCLVCKSPYGLSPSNTCLNCSASCATCKTTNYLECITCKPGYSLSGVSCVACSEANCSSCPNSTTVCVSCVAPYGIYSGACVACYTNCLTCKGENYQACKTCRSYNFLDETSETCESCSSSCSQCQNLTYCETCDPQFYLDEVYQCTPCLSICTGCEFDPISIGPSCTGCIAGYILIEESSYFECKLPCIVGSLDYPCSLKFGNLWDGCNDACEVEENFNCSSPQICSYMGNVSLNFTSISKEALSNFMTIETEVYPPLFVFTESDLLSVFKITNPYLKLTSITFHQETNKLTFVAEILNDVNNITEITIKFNPSLSSDGRYEATPDDEYAFDILFPKHLPYYYTPIALLAMMLLFYLSWVSVVLSCMAAILGWVLRRLAGIEAIIVLQFGFVNILWLDSYLHPYYQQTWPLKFSTGYAYPFIEEEKAIGSGFNYAAPYTSQFSLSSEFLLNNFNIMLGVQVCAAVITTISKMILKVLLANIQETEEVLNPKKPKSVKRTEWVYEFSLQTLFYFTMINLVNFISCSTLWFKYGDKTHMGSIICFAATVLVTVAVSIYFLYDPDPFGYFRYSFRYTISSCFNELAFKQFSIYEAVIILSTCFLILTSVPFVAIILLFCLALHILIYAPYKEKKENWRASLNLIAMCGVATLRTYLLYLPLPNHNDLILNILLILVYGGLFTIVSFLAFAFTAYHYIYWKFIKPKEDENNEEEILRKEKYIVYDMLDDFNLNKRVKDNPKNNNIFSKVGKSKLTLLEFSNELFKESIESKVHLENLGSKSTEIEGEGNSSARVLHKKQIHVPKLKDESCARQEVKIAETKVLEPFQIELKNVKSESKVGSSGQCMEESALQVLADENMYISLKYSENKMKELLKDPEDKNAYSFQNAYDEIPSERGLQSIIKEEPIEEEQEEEELSENEMIHKMLDRQA